MFYREYQPPVDLAEYVQLIWTIESEEDSDHYPREQILPDGIVELVFHYRDPFVTHQADGISYIQPASFAISQMKKFIEIESNEGIGLIAVRFFPWGAYHFFDTPIKSFLDGFVDAEFLWETTHSQIVEQVRSAATHLDRLHCVEQFLLARLKEHRHNGSAVDAAIKLCRDQRGQLRVEELCERVQLSKKQLERQFSLAVGTTPRVFCRVSRFLDVCHRLREYQQRTLTELTHECGYFDQAHFIKDFKQFSGFTPKQFFDRNNVSFADI